MNPSNRPHCRFCKSSLEHTFVDLGASPLCQSFLSADQLNHMEPFYPLSVYVCGKCFLVQLQEYVAPQDIFSDYLYFASFSDTWLAHVKAYTDQMVKRFPITEKSLVVEIASNDGYLLQYFVEKKVPVLGIEPAANVAAVAIQKGIPSLVKFFGSATARELVASGKHADLLLGKARVGFQPVITSRFFAGAQLNHSGINRP